MISNPKQSLYERHTCQTHDEGLIRDIHASLTTRINVRRRYEMTTQELALQNLNVPEIWRQDTLDPDLWHAPNGLMLNSAALSERAAFYTTIKLTSSSVACDVQDFFYA